MLTEQRKQYQREYQKKWRAENREKVKEYRKRSAMKQAIQDINDGKTVNVLKKVIVMQHDEEYSTDA